MPIMINLKKRLKQKIFAKLQERYPIDPSMMEIAYTPNQKMGDLALSFPFQLAGKMKKNPREIALEIISHLLPLNGVEKIEAAGAGYINLFLNRKDFFAVRLHNLEKTSLSSEEEKIIIEHTNINPNKAAHIGHLRNAVLGDTLGRCLKHKRENVEIQNYVDDTGVQVVDVVFGFMEMEKKSQKEIQEIENKFDNYCWDLYAKVSSYLEAHPETQSRKSEILKKIEDGQGTESDIAHYISRRILKAHLFTMKRLGINYDLLPCESSIIHLKFWQKAFELLKRKKAISFVDSGVNKGCWVMRLEDVSEKEKIIVRSDGTVTYVGKDIAYQLWKFGLLDNDFFYKPFAEEDSKTIWITTVSPHQPSPQFGKASLVYNVIDSRQSYLQKVVVQGLRSLGFNTQADKSIHFSYEMVALSPNSLKELDIDLSPEDRGKNFLEVSGRKGLGVRADDLLDRLEEKALAEVEKRNPRFLAAQKAAIAHNIACGALRYFMLKFARNSLIIFDFEDALSFEGETGPYLQYTVVRINSIFRNLEERENFGKEELQSLLSAVPLSPDLLAEAEKCDFWDLVFYASQFEEEVLHSIQSLEFSHLAKFTFNLSQKFNGYYHKYSILAEENSKIKNFRILILYYIKSILEQALSLMGIPLPERM